MRRRGGGQTHPSCRWARARAHEEPYRKPSLGRATGRPAARRGSRISLTGVAWCRRVDPPTTPRSPSSKLTLFMMDPSVLNAELVALPLDCGAYLSAHGQHTVSTRSAHGQITHGCGACLPNGGNEPQKVTAGSRGSVVCSATLTHHLPTGRGCGGVAKPSRIAQSP